MKVRYTYSCWKLTKERILPWMRCCHCDCMHKPHSHWGPPGPDGPCWYALCSWQRSKYEEGARIACWWECRTRDQNFVSSNPSMSFWRIFFSRPSFVWWFIFGVRSTSMLMQWHVKDPGHSAKSANGRLHLNMHTSFTQRNRRWLTMPLSRCSVRTYPETSSHATCQGIFRHSCLILLSHCGLILA